MFGVDCVIIYLYLDDIPIFDTNINVSNAIKLFRFSHFKMKHLCETKVMHLTSIIENVLVYVNHTFNTIKDI